MTIQIPTRVVALIAMDADEAADAQALVAASRSMAEEIGARAAVVMAGATALPQMAAGVTGLADDAWLMAVPELAVPPQAQQLVPVFAQALHDALGADLDSTLIVMRSSPLNDEIAARLGARLDAAVLGRCSRIARDADTGGMLAWRDVCGGRLQAALSWQAGPAVAVMRVARQTTQEAGSDALPTMLAFNGALPAAVSFTETSQGQRPAGFVGAEVIVSGGRGIGGEAGVAALHALASHLNAPVGGSLPAVDAGWFPISHQIGQSGSYVSPAVYLAVGISGTPQHLAGVDPASAIVAINQDPEAPIFGVARVGVVAEWAEFLPHLSAELQRMAAGGGSA